MNELLSIAIPTYNRSRYLLSLLLSINEQYSQDIGNLIHIYIFDNGAKDDIKKLLKKLDLKFSYTYTHHDFNMGGKNNVHYAYTHTLGKYIWVIGDDEILPPKSLKEILRLMRKYSPGLIITRGSLYDPFIQSAECYTNYTDLALDCLNTNPYFLIAHSLISANIIRSDCFDADFAKQQIESGYSHFFAIINGIIDKKSEVVYAKKITLIVRSNRARMQFDKGDNQKTILFEQNRYISWLFKKLKDLNTNQHDKLNDFEMNLINKWRIYLSQKDQNPELRTIRSILIDHKFRTLMQKKDHNYRVIKESEEKLLQSFCDKFDHKVLSLPNDYESSEGKAYNNKKTNIPQYNNENYGFEQNKRATEKSKKVTLAVWGFYEEAFKNNWIFFNPNAAIGDELLKPMNEFHRIALNNDIELKSLDMVQNFDEVDAFLFWDFPKMDNNPLVIRAITSKKPCYLVIAESPIILPDNWIEHNQIHFSKIFTYYDDIIDNKKYFKLNYATEIPLTIHQDIKRKKHFCTMIAGCKYVKHELSLYPHRIEAIRWFEKHHPDEFDLYGIGWDPNKIPSYKGRIKSKLEVLKDYKFSICYENIRDIKGYITEKIFDSMKAGCVPIYWGARNVSDHIPKGCFIDKRDFPDYESLYTYLKEMSDEDYQEYLKNIEDFFNSKAVYPFTTESFIKTLLENITDQPIEISSPKDKSSGQSEAAKSKKQPSVTNAITKPVFYNGSRWEGPLVSISMVHYNRLDCLKDCIESIRRHTSGPYELIIIDNGSTDGSPDYLRSLSDITLIEIPSNIRPDFASLKGLAMAKGDYIATISDDIIVTPGWLDLFLEHMKQNPKVGLIGPRSNFVSGPQLVPNVPYKNIQELDAFAEQWTNNFQGNFSNANRLVGFILFFSRELLNKIGGTDPIFSFGFNDDDFTLRAIIAGYDAIIADDIFIHHTGGPQMRGDFEYKRKLGESWEAFKTKWGLPPALEDSDLDIRPILSQEFDSKRHFVPLPDPSEVRKLIYRPERDSSTLQPGPSENDDDIPISFLVTVYNEEERIPYVLESAVKWADEIIVVNKSSTDRTKEICLQFGEKVKVVDMPFSHQGDGNMVTYAKIPTHDWIFFGTASEIPTKSLINRIKQLLRDTNGELDLMYVPRKYYSFGIHDKRSPWSISYFPFMVNRKKTIIRDVIHHNFTPRNPNNVVKIEYADDCCVYHLTHTSAKGYLHAMTDYFTAEAEECENPSAKIQECMANIAKYENQLRSGGEDLLGHYFAWQIYWLGTALSVWEKWRGIDVERYYKQLRKNVCEREWIEDNGVDSVYLKNQAPQTHTPEEKPLVSAIVSAYNSERFIRGCLEDLESQTISDRLEIIVIDSASEQNEEAVIKEFQNKYSNIKYLRTEQRETVYAAWNRGIKAASGKFITNANTDDRHVPYAFERMVHVLGKTPEVSLVYADVWITENENETFENFTPAGRCRFSWKDFDPKTLIDGCYIGPQPMWRKTVHEKHGYFDEEFHSAGDWEFWLRISKTEKFLHLKEILGLYLKSPTGIENRDPKVSGEEVLRIRRLYGSRNAEKMYQDAQLLVNNGMKREAMAALLKLLDAYPDFAMAHNDLGVLYSKENDKDNTLKYYKRAAELEPENFIFAKNLADFYFVGLGCTEKAMELYVKVLASNPMDVETLASIGHICISLEKYDNARVFFTRILEVDPWNQDVKNIVDDLMKKQGMEDVDQGIEVGLQGSNNTGIDLAEKMFQDAQERRKKEGDKEGIRCLKKLLEAYPDFGLAHNDLGVLYFKQGEKEKALVYYEHAAWLEPHNNIFQKNLADFYFVEAGRVEEALEIYVRLLETNPTDIEILLIMGRICESMEKIEDARVFYIKVLEVEPSNMEAREKIVELADGLEPEFRGRASGRGPIKPITEKTTPANNEVVIENKTYKEGTRIHSYSSRQKDSAVP